MALASFGLGFSFGFDDVFYWYSMATYETNPLINTALGFIVFNLPIIFILLMSLAILPDSKPEKSLDLKIWYLEQRKYFFLLHVGYLLTSLVVSFFKDMSQENVMSLLPAIMLSGFIVSLAFSKNVKYHSLITIIVLIFDLLSLIFSDLKL